MTIKPATTDHYQSIASIYNEYILEGGATMEEKIHEPKDIAAWVSNFNKSERLYVIEGTDKVIGWGIIKKYSDRNGYRFAAETAVYLTATELGKGYGSQMKKYLIEQARLLKYRHLVAKIFAKNEASVNYNVKLGYTIVGTQNKIGFKNGEWQDIVILQLLLD